MASRSGQRDARTQAAVGNAGLKGLIEHVELRSLQLLSSNAQLDASALGDNGDVELEVHLPPTQFRYQIAAEGDALVCGLKFRLEIKSNGESTAPVVAITAEYVAIYDVSDPSVCTPETARQFASRNAAFNCWPFFRELAYSMTSKMGIPPVTIPLMKLSRRASRARSD